MTSSAKKKMGGRRFVIDTLLLAALACAGVAAINWHINFYGVFGDVRGENRTVVASERQTKYLYSFNYIPANFDALLVGSSIASNFDTALVHGVRMYNAAISGGNITEEKLIAENALVRGHFRLVVLCVNPYLIQTHGRKAGGMDPRDMWGAIGSTDLVSSYVGALAIRLGWIHGRFTPEGMQDIEAWQRQAKHWDGEGNGKVAPKQVAPANHALMLDTTALDELSKLAQLARAQGATVVWLFAPVYLPIYRERRSGYAKFENAIHSLSEPDDLTVDMNDGSFDALTSQATAFLDGVHLSNKGALDVVHALNQAILIRER